MTDLAQLFDHRINMEPQETRTEPAATSLERMDSIPAREHIDPVIVLIFPRLHSSTRS